MTTLQKSAVLLAVLGIGVLSSRFFVTSVPADMPLSEDFVSVRPAIAASATSPLSEEERAGLVFMREEEKLARDVYTTLGDVWGTQIFSNIAQSEQTHTEAVRQLLEKYTIVDPVVDDTVGVFTDKRFDALYQQLVGKGKTSLVAALQVGAEIEDLDIRDLDIEIAKTNNEDILMVYEQLQRGSRNHLRAFVRQLTARDASYEPQYISSAVFAAILQGDTERGSGRGWGGGR
jgi:hypothetical protein